MRFNILFVLMISGKLIMSRVLRRTGVQNGSNLSLLNSEGLDPVVDADSTAIASNLAISSIVQK